jgi:excisionase family DNA binding protein
MYVGTSMGHLARVEERERLLLTVVEAAAMLGVGRTKAYELIAGGELQAVHIGRAARVPLVAVRRYVDGLVSQGSRTIHAAPRSRVASQPPLPFIDLTKD